MCGNNNKTSKATTTQQALPWVQDAYKSLFSTAAGAASTPYTPYGGTLVPELNSSFGAASSAAGGLGAASQPFYNSARDYATAGGQSVMAGVPQFSAEALEQYQNPYRQSVIDATLADLNRADATAQNDLLGRSIMSGASPFGGDRAGIAAATLAGEQSRGRATTVAGLRDQGYQQAVDQFNTQQGLAFQGNATDRSNAFTASQAMAGIGGAQNQTEMDRINALLTTGGVQQSRDQAAADAAYEQWRTANNYPFETANFLAGIYGGGPALGGTTVEETPKPGFLQQLFGAIGAVGSILPFQQGGPVRGYASGGAVDTDSGFNLTNRIPAYRGGLYVPGALTDIDENGDPIGIPVSDAPVAGLAAPAPPANSPAPPAAGIVAADGASAGTETPGGVRGFLGGIGGRFEEDRWRLPLLMGSLAMMTSQSPTFLGAAGEGGIGALNAVMGRRAQEAEAAARQAELDAETEIITDPATGDVYVWHPSTNERTLLFEGAGPARATPIEVDGRLVDPNSMETVWEAPADTFTNLVTPESRANAGIAPDDLRPYQVNNATGELSVVGGGGVNVSVGGADGTPVPAGFRAVDTAYAPEYAAWTASGGYADVQRQTQAIADVVAQLEGGENLTGPIIGATPDALLAIFNPSALDARDRVQEVVQRNLRAILGAQFTQVEGDRLIARAFNPSLPDEVNAARLQALLVQMDAAARAKQEAADYFRQYGTLWGWTGTVPSVVDFDTAIDAAVPGVEDTPAPVNLRTRQGSASTPANFDQRFDPNGWVDMGGGIRYRVVP
jgi:hypothetical protein